MNKQKRNKKANLTKKQKKEYLVYKFIIYLLLYVVLEIAFIKILQYVVNNCITTL